MPRGNVESGGERQMEKSVEREREKKNLIIVFSIHSHKSRTHARKRGCKIMSVHLLIVNTMCHKHRFVDP